MNPETYNPLRYETDESSVSNLPIQAKHQKNPGSGSTSSHSSSSKASDGRNAKGSAAFYVMLATVFLAPLVFVPSPYLTLDAVKAIVIIVGILLSAILYAFSAMKEGKLSLPPRRFLWVGGLLAVSLILSSILSSHFVRSFFGQGFEYGPASFILALLLSALVAFAVARDHAERTMVFYVGISISFLILYVFHAVRMIAGPEFMSLSFLDSVTSTIYGNWYSLGAFAALVMITSSLAAIMLPLSKGMKSAYWLLAIVSFSGAFIINNVRVWQTAAVVFLGIFLFMTFGRKAEDERGMLFRVAWMPLIIFVILAAFAWRGTAIASKAITSLGADYTELTVPWQATLDVAAGTLKTDPIFGAGPNRFFQEYIKNKPAEMNLTIGWNADFNSGFGTLPTFVITQGLVGGILWLAFLVVFALAGIAVLSRLPVDPRARYILISSYSGAAFLWLMAILYTPSHALFMLAFILTGLWLGSAVSYGLLRSREISLLSGGQTKAAATASIWVLVIVAAVWGAWHIKQFAALAYFSEGVKILSVSGDAVKADEKFKVALAMDESDVYWRARVEAGITAVSKLVASASSSQAPAQENLLKQIGDVVTNSVQYAKAAVEYDPTNHYNHLSEARVYEMASSIRIENAYENGVKSYEKAIELNPSNPAIYLNLARLHASMNKMDEAVVAIGNALRLKNNYLDAIFLLSQIEAGRGNLRDAIIAASVASELNPANPVIWFQLGLLQYTSKDFQSAAKSFENAITVQPDYANAKYFLGLSYVQTGKRADAIKQFEALTVTNPDNAEVKLILENLSAGRGPFVNAKPPVTSSPEKRQTPPLKQTR